MGTHSGVHSDLIHTHPNSYPYLKHSNRFISWIKDNSRKLNSYAIEY